LARLGSVGDTYTISLAGSSLTFSGQLATKQLFAATEVILLIGHFGTKLSTTISCQPSSTTLHSAGSSTQVSHRNSPRHSRGSRLL